VIEAVSISSDKQAFAIEEVNKSIEQIATVVESTSATAQESSATSEELLAQSEALNDLVSQFTIRES
jgi:methyl-accepting chemotaxis protein